MLERSCISRVPDIVPPAPTAAPAAGAATAAGMADMGTINPLHTIDEEIGFDPVDGSIRTGLATGSSPDPISQVTSFTLVGVEARTVTVEVALHHPPRLMRWDRPALDH